MKRLSITAILILGLTGCMKPLEIEDDELISDITESVEEEDSDLDEGEESAELDEDEE